MRPSLRHKAPGSLSTDRIVERRSTPSRILRTSSSRSLGRCLLLDQRSRMNLLSHHVRSLLHQDHRNPRAQLTGHRHNGHPRTNATGMAAANGAKKFPKLPVLADRRPGGLDEFASQPAVSSMGDRSPMGFLSRRALAGNQSQKPSELAHVLKLPPVADAGQELTAHNPANPTNTHHILNALQELRVVLAKLANFFTHLHYLLLRKLHPVQQLIELEAYALRALKLSQLGRNVPRPQGPGRRQWERDAFDNHQRIDPLLGAGSLSHRRVGQMREVAWLTIHRRGNVTALKPSTA